MVAVTSKFHRGRKPKAASKAAMSTRSKSPRAKGPRAGSRGRRSRARMPVARYSTYGLLLYWLITTLVIIGLAVWACNQAHAGISDCIEATCRITDPAGGRGTGCAFERSQGQVFVLTNAHVVEGYPTVQCEFWHAGHQSLPLVGRVIARSPQADAAIVAIPETAFGGVLPSVIPVAPKDRIVGPGETVISVGCADGKWSTGWKGHALGYVGQDLRFVPPPAQGRSGSAIFDAEGEHIVALLRARTSDDREGVATSLQSLCGSLGQESAYDQTLARCSQPTQCGPGGCPATPPPQWRLLPYRQQQEYRDWQGSGPYPTLPSPAPSPQPTPAPRIDFSSLEQRLDHIAALLEKKIAPEPAGPLVPIPAQPAAPAASGLAPDAKSADAKSDKALADATDAKKVAAEAVAKVEAKAAESDTKLGKLQEGLTGLHGVIQQLTGDVTTLPERFQTRLDKVKAELPSEASTREIARAYAKDLIAEKLSDGALGMTAGKLLGGALGLSGPLALALGGGLWLLARQLGAKVKTGEPLVPPEVVNRVVTDVEARLAPALQNLKDRLGIDLAAGLQDLKAHVTHQVGQNKPSGTP